jgi:VWFA-related protein
MWAATICLILSAGGGRRSDPLAAFQEPPQQRRPVFRGGSAYVIVDVYPQADGRIVEGLTAKDFQILEDGTPQTIEAFEFVRTEPTRSEAARVDPNSQRDMQAQAADPTNRVFVAYLDKFHVTVTGSHDIRAPLIDTLNRIIAPNDLFGVLTPDIPARHLVLGRRMLGVEEQLSRHWPWGERQRTTANPDDPIETWFHRCFAYRPPDHKVEWLVPDGATMRRLDRVLIERRREAMTLDSVENLMSYLGALREARTVVILISDGWRLFGRDPGIAEEAVRFGAQTPSIVNRGGRPAIGTELNEYSHPANCASELVRLATVEHDRRLRDIIARATRANVSFYPVAASGLTVFETSIAQQVQERARPSPAARGQTALSENVARTEVRIDALRTLADNTDGLAVVSTNDLAGGLRRIVNDVSAYYVLGYYSTNTRQDGRFRRIEVKTSRPNVHIRARRGYVAPVPPDETAAAATPPAPRGPAVPDEAFSLLGRIRPGTSVYAYGIAEPDALHVAVELPRGRAGAAVRPVRLSIVSQTGAHLDAAGDITPPQRSTAIRVPLAGATGGPWKASVTVDGGADPERTEYVIEPATTTALIGDPRVFRANSSLRSPLWPVADFQFTRTERLHAEWRLRADLDRRTARLLGRDGQPLAVPVTVTERDQNGSRVLALDISLAPLGAGDYLIEVTVGSGSTAETRYVPLRVTR